MCDDHGHTTGLSLSRRRLLQGMVVLAAFAGLGGSRPPVVRAPLAPRAPSVDGLRAFVLGMHLHASASEGVGSMRSQLSEAAGNGFDVAWFTEHDWRRRRLLFRPAYRFRDSDIVYGGAWRLTKMAAVGRVADAGGGLITRPVSPADPGGGALRLQVRSKDDEIATVRRRIDATGLSRVNFRARIAGRTLTLDVLPRTTGADAWGEVLLGLSHHPATGGRPAGVYALLYRLRTDISARAVSADGLTATVDVPVTPDEWTTVTLDPTADAAAAWPDVEAADNSLSAIEFHVSSRRMAPAEMLFSYLRFDELTGYDGLGVEHSLLNRYGADAEDTSALLGLIGTEISLGPHLNQYGGAQQPFDYGDASDLTNGYSEIRPAVVEWIHRQGGLASINHPFKPGDVGQLGSPEAVAANILQIRGGGADMLEVGYADKQGGDLAGHLAVWDTLSRNALFLTANGVSDDHTGQDWATQTNRFYTAAWAARKTEAALLAALRAGRGYVGFLGGFAGTVDMDLDGEVRMGQIAATSPSRRTLNVRVTAPPLGGAVELVRGVVDPRGAADPRPNTTVRTLDADVTSVQVDTGDDCFHRLQVVDSAGAVVAFGQPIWTFRGAPPTTVPAARRAVSS
jgi:hypothetical protein